VRPGRPPPRREDGAEEHRHEDEVVGAEDLVPVDERVEGGEARRGEPSRRALRQASGESDHQRVEQQRHEPRIEGPERRPGGEVERHHHQVRPRQVRVVAQDGIAAARLPEARDARLTGEDRAGVVRSVGAFAGEDLVERQRKLHDTAVLPVGAVGG